MNARNPRVMVVWPARSSVQTLSDHFCANAIVATYNIAVEFLESAKVNFKR